MNSKTTILTLCASVFLNIVLLGQLQRKNNKKSDDLRDVNHEATQEPSVLDVLNSDDYWGPVHAETFTDGGSVALGLVNGNGEVIYLWAKSTGFLEKGEPQTLFLQLNYNDPNQVIIQPDSELEGRIINLLDTLDIRKEQEVAIPLVNDFKDALMDRTNHVYEEYYRYNADEY